MDATKLKSKCSCVDCVVNYTAYKYKISRALLDNLSSLVKDRIFIKINVTQSYGFHCIDLEDIDALFFYQVMFTAYISYHITREFKFKFLL